MPTTLITISYIYIYIYIYTKSLNNCLSSIYHESNDINEPNPHLIWRKAMQKELKALNKIHAWNIVK